MLLEIESRAAQAKFTLRHVNVAARAALRECFAQLNNCINLIILERGAHDKITIQMNH